MKKRQLIPALLLLALVTPVVLVATAPDLRQRARVLWERQRLRSTNPATRKATIADLLARKDDDLDELFPDLVAAAVMNVDSRTVFVARGASANDRDTIHVVYDRWSDDHVAVERSFGPTPPSISMHDAWGHPQSRVFDLGYLVWHGGRMLWVAKGDEVQLLVPLRVETGDRIVEAVEQRLRAGQ